MLTICTWLWGDKFSLGDVDRLRACVKRHLIQPHRFVVVTDRNPREIHGEAWPIPAMDWHLTKIKGCFARLRMFDPSWQRANGLLSGNRLALIDLDTVITGPLDPLFDRPEPFVIMQGGNAVNPCPYGGALMMLRAGAHSKVWTEFSIDAARTVPYYEFPDDQAWLAAKVPNAPGWKVGSNSGAYVYQKPGWPGGKTATELPAGARLVTFINRNPRDLQHLDWIREHWQ